MRTEELKRLLYEDLGEFYSETDDVIHGVFWDVWKKQQRLVVRGVIQGGVLTTLVKYHNTPLNEREDEKKYRIESLNVLYKSDNNLYLIRNYSNDTFLYTANFHDTTKFQAFFTQQQIDTFPAEIKAAIKCGFLRKVEVNE